MQGKYFLSFSSNGDLRRERCNNGNLESDHYFWNRFTPDIGEFLIIFHRGVKLNPPVLGTLELPLLAAQSQSHSTERRRDIYFKYLNRRQGRESNTATHGSENYYISTNVSSPIGLSEFWESEPMWTCKNINSIHDQGCRYHYLDDKPSK